MIIIGEIAFIDIHYQQIPIQKESSRMASDKHVMVSTFAVKHKG